ncbi:MAG: class I SAM-dependent methyltransferase [Candidatus Aenigmatarchaeota archaeon]
MESKQFYNRIADSWYNIRHWSLFQDELGELNERWDEGKLLNIGCAHGPDFLPFDPENFDFYGTDISKGFMDLARKFARKNDRNFNLFVSDMRDLPLQDGSFDYIISVAALHHLLEKKNRLKALEEMKRVLRKGGEALITVWNSWQKDFLFRGREIEKEWNYKNEVLYRDYYLYNYPELKKDLEETGFEIVKLYPEQDSVFPIKYFSKNIIALVRKT